MNNFSEFREWLMEEQGLGDRTAHTYYKAVKSMAKRKNMIAALRDDRAASTKHLYWAALKQWAKFSQDEELAQEVDSPKIRRLAMKTGSPAQAIEPYTEEEVNTFRTALDRLRGAPGVEPWVWPAVSLMLTLGLRARVDLCRLTRKSSEEGIRTGRLIIRTKRDKFRTLPADLVEEELQKLLDIPKWKYLYEVMAPSSIDSESLAYRRLVRVLKQVAELSGLDPATIRSHRFRHTAAMQLYEASGHDIRLVQQFLGHDQLQTTVGYLRLDRTDEMGKFLKAVKHGRKA
jgi:integrase